jgi:hypothetical protein
MVSAYLHPIFTEILVMYSKHPTSGADETMKHGYQDLGVIDTAIRKTLALPHKGEGGNMRSIHIPRISLIQRLKIRVETICPDLAFLCEFLCSVTLGPLRSLTIAIPT